jgi:hypothetical protein
MPETFSPPVRSEGDKKKDAIALLLKRGWPYEATLFSQDTMVNNHVKIA